MGSLVTNYMGLELKNPIVVGSCGLTGDVEKIKKIEQNGAAAVVLKSIFEDQIIGEVQSLHSPRQHTEEYDYINNYVREHDLEIYLDLIEKAKNEVDIPIIASINCSTPKEWIHFIKEIQEHGADAVELNVFILPGNIDKDGREIEKIYFDIIKNVKKVAKIPVSIKLSHYFSGLANFVAKLSSMGLDGIVLFNRFFSPDIDIDNMEFTSTTRYSSPGELSLPLRWIGLLSGKVDTDLVASTGIHNGQDIIKCVLAGAKAVEIVSVLYKNGIEEIETIKDFLAHWLDLHHYDTIREMIGKLNQSHLKDPSVYERAQFMKYFHK